MRFFFFNQYVMPKELARVVNEGVMQASVR